jgi:hypothetical protein
MTRFSLKLPVFALIALITVGTIQQDRILADELVCGEYGTSINFAASAEAAAKQATREEKLVFVLHVSGLFEESNFT